MSPTNISSVSSAISGGLAAIAGGTQQLNRDAQRVANPGSDNVTGALVDMSQSLLLAEAGANVISASNKMLGSLLDVMA